MNPSFNMEALPPIPTPPRLLWREFCLRVVPVLFFCALVAVVAVMWSQVNTAQTLTGVGEGARSLVSSPQAGLLWELKVRPYQLVNQGEVIAVVQPVDPRMPLELFQAEMQVARLRSQPSMAEENAMNYERVRSDMMRARSELAVARVNLSRALNEVNRNTPLFQKSVISEEIYDFSLKSRDAFQAEVTEKSNAVHSMEQRLQELRALGDPQLAATNNPFQELLGRLDTARDSAVSNWGPITLVAPISGMVSVVYRQQGEYVVDGELIVGVHALWSERVVGYLRQPYPVDPEIGMPVKVTTRNQKRVEFWTSISQVGAQVEVITNVLAFVRQGTLVDAGLPIIMDLPPECRIRPGEVVDLWIRPTAVQSRNELVQ